MWSRSLASSSGPNERPEPADSAPAHPPDRVHEERAIRGVLVRGSVVAQREADDATLPVAARPEHRVHRAARQRGAEREHLAALARAVLAGVGLEAVEL